MINFSTTLERIGITDIGRKSTNDFTVADLGTGVTSALFHNIYQVRHNTRSFCSTMFEDPINVGFISRS